MKKLFIAFVLLITGVVYAAEFDFASGGNTLSNEILIAFIEDEIPDTHFETVSYFCDLNNDGDEEIIGIIKSNLFYNLKGYKLFVLKKKDKSWTPVHSDINFDNSMPVTVDNGKIRYFGGALDDGKKYTAQYKNNEIKTRIGLFDWFRNRKRRQIESVTAFSASIPKSVMNLDDFNGATQKSVNIYYKNLDERTKHYLNMQ